MTDCEFCPMKYLSRQALRAHEKAEHMDKNELWLCMFCTKTYISRHELRSHIVSKHPADFHQKLREFHNERLKTEDLQKSTLPPVAPKVDQKDGQLLCELCNTVCKTFGLFSLARITEAQKTCILNHTSTSTQKTIRWFMKSHFPYFYDKYLCEKSVSTKLSKFQNFHMNCPLKVTHVNRWKRQQTSTKRKNVEVPIIKSEYKALPTSGPLPKLLRLAPKGLMSGQSVVLAAPETK